MSRKLNSVRLDYCVPVVEMMGDMPGQCSIRGVAINACTTRNGMTYTAEELEKAAPSLSGKPLLKNHNNTVESIVGKVTGSAFNPALNRIEFTATVMDPMMTKMVREGMVSAVSIGAMCQEIVETDTTAMCKGIEFLELSLVAVPADPNAGFVTSNGFEAAITESLKSVSKEKSMEADVKMVDEKVQNDVSVMEAIKALSAEVSEMKKAQEAKVEAPVEKKTDATKGKVATAVAAEADDEDFIVESVGNGKSAVWKMPGPHGQLW